jgi:ABC-type dipeptide/oligopeptide/nickel transport system permease component
MTRYLAGRIVGLLVTIWLITIVVFALMKSVPGGPFVFDKQPLPPEAMENINRKYGLDGPVYVQYLRWVGAAVRGDFGVPFQSPTETVIGLIQRAWPITILVGVITLAIAFGIGIPLGVLAATHQNSWIDRGLTFVASLGLTIPNFVVAIWLIYAFAVHLKWLPTGGWGEPKHLIMPVIAYAMIPMASIARFTRTSVLDVMRADYVRLARARGVPEGTIMRRYVLRNALVPLITVFGPEIPNILTGSIFVEATFVIPGLGRFFVTSLTARDYPMIMALVLLVALLWGVTYIVSDVLYSIADPRIRVGGRRAA